MRVNFSDAVERGNFDAFRGRHHVCITNVEPGESKGGAKLPTGTPGLTFEFTVQEGKYENRRVWNNFWIHPNTLGFLKTCLGATGEFTEEELEGDLDLSDGDEEFGRVIGLDLVITTKIRPAKGEYDERTEIKGYYPYDENEDYSGDGSESNADASFMPS
jgi:hypothetical protein